MESVMTVKSRKQ